MGETLYDFCVRRGDKALLDQWDETRNAPLTPRTVTCGSRKKVWWNCPRGHVWQAVLVSRTSGGTGCPVCAGKVVISGENDLASRNPDLAKQWHSEKNGPLTPQGISPYSNRKVWWKCAAGHAYQASVGARAVNGSDCPYCAGRKVLAGFNDLAALEPVIAKQWHPVLNGSLTAEMVTVGSHRRVWWQCPEGHVWKAVIYSRTGQKKAGCPVCAGKVRPLYRGQSAVLAEVGSNRGESRV